VAWAGVVWARRAEACCATAASRVAATAMSSTGSDIDIPIALVPGVPIGLFEYVGTIQYLDDLFPPPIDVANRDRLKPLVRPSVGRDVVLLRVHPNASSGASNAETPTDLFDQEGDVRCLDALLR
jgi:uncharacterized protein